MHATTNGKSEEASMDLAAENDRVLQATLLLRRALVLLDSTADRSVMALDVSVDRLLRLPAVEQRTGLGRSAIYDQM